jgi:hypothetical protein
MAWADYQQLLADMVTDTSGTVSADMRDRAIAQAGMQYSKDVGREVVNDITWPTAGVFAPAPADWDERAWVRSAEYPVGQTPVSKLFVQAYRSPTGWMLESADALSAGAVVRLTYSTVHLLDAVTDTIPAHHRHAVAAWAASVLCVQLATFWSGQREPMLGADVSQTETRAREFAARAKEYRSAYYVGIERPDPYKSSATGGASPAVVQAAASVAAWPGRRRLLSGRGGAWSI